MKASLPEVMRFSLAASIQQSVMNFGILMIQGLVNSFGTSVMAAFAAAVKIDSFAYMPAQEFSNSFSILLHRIPGQEIKKSPRRSTHLCKTVYQLLSGGIGVDLPLREVSDDDFCAS